MVMNTSVKIGKLKLKNPVMVASGTFGVEHEQFMDLNRLGALVLKTVTLTARAGNPPPRIVETAAGMLNAIGLENNGIDDFIKNKLPRLDKIKTPVIVSIAGESDAEYVKLAERLDGIKKVDGLELNLSCPNIQGAGMIAQDAQATYEVVAKVRKATRRTIIAKLSPNVTDITVIAKAAEDAGADALSLVNTFIGMSVDIENKRPRLGNVTGGLSGPAIKPLALRMVWETYRKVTIPIIGIGGIMDCTDALEFILCGAAAVQVGTANLVHPAAAVEIIQGIEKFLKVNRVADINSLRGALRTQ